MNFDTLKTQIDKIYNIIDTRTGHYDESGENIYAENAYEQAKPPVDKMGKEIIDHAYRLQQSIQRHNNISSLTKNIASWFQSKNTSDDNCVKTAQQLLTQYGLKEAVEANNHSTTYLHDISQIVLSIYTIKTVI